MAIDKTEVDNYNTQQMSELQMSLYIERGSYEQMMCKRLYVHA